MRYGFASFAIALLATSVAQAAQSDAGRAVVLVYSKSLEGSGAGHGFVVGDGTLVVTARHNVFGEAHEAKHRPDVMVEVLSRYLGDVCSAQVVADDRELDVAVLSVSWKGHPGLELAEVEATAAATSVLAVGYPALARAGAEGETKELEKLVDERTEKLPVDFLAVREGVPLFIQARGASAVANDWSGCPFLDAGKAVGCLTTLGTLEKRAGKIDVVARGTTSVQIRRIIDDAKLTDRMKASATTMPTDKAAAEVTQLFMWSWALSAAGKHELSYGAANGFVVLRPDSSVGFAHLASEAAQLGWLDKAEKAYEKAMALDPKSATIRILYGQFLAEHDQQERAMQMYRSVWEPSQTNTIAIIPMVNLLLKQNRYGQTMELLKRGVEVNPNDGFLWMYLGQRLEAMTQHADAAAAFSRAVELMPHKTMLHAAAAGEFEACGQAANAEKQYRQMVETDPQGPVAHFLLAQFLAKDSTRQTEALAEAQTALGLPARSDSPPRERMQQLVARLQQSTRGVGRSAPASQTFKL